MEIEIQYKNKNGDIKRSHHTEVESEEEAINEAKELHGEIDIEIVREL